MPEIIQDLKLKSDPSTIVRPNVVSSNIPANAITTGKIADEALTTGKIANEAITSAKIAPGAVSSAKLEASAVLESKIANNAVTQNKIASGAVTETKIGPEAVTSGKISPLAVTFTKLKYTRKTAAELLSLCPTLHDFYLFIDTFRVRMLSFFSYSLAEMAYPTHYFFDANAEVVYMEEYNDNDGKFEYTKLQTDSDYITFVQNHRLSMQYMG